MAQCLLDTHIPNDLRQDEIRSLARIAPDTTNVPLIFHEEIAIAVKTFKNDKSPGMDLKEVKVLKILIREIPEQFLRVFNGAFSGASFLQSGRRSHYESF